MANGGVVVVISGKDDTEKVFQAIEANLKRTTAAAHETEGAFAQLGERAKRYLEYAGIALSIRAVVDSFKDAVTSSLEYGEAIAKASQNTGLASETLSVLHYVSDTTHSDFDGLTSAVSKMGAAIGEAADGGNKKAAAALAAVGLNAKELANQSGGVEEAFRRVAEKIADTTNASKQLELAKALLGRASSTEVDLLVKVARNWDEYKQQAQAAGTYLTTQGAAALAKTSEKLEDLKEHILGASIEFTEALAPALEGVASGFSAATGGTNLWSEAGKQAALTVIPLAAAIMELVQGLRMAQDEYRNLVAAVQIANSYISGPAWTENMRSKDKADRDAAVKQLHDSKADHDAAEKEESEFLARMKDLKDQIESGAAYKTRPDPTIGPKGKPIGRLDLGGEADKIRAAKQARDAAQTRLDEQMAQLRAQIAKGSEEQQLADLEDSHKRALISDQDFYARKLAIEKASFDAQRQAAQDKQADIDKQIASLTSDEKKQGANSSKGIEDEAKILDLHARRLQIDGEIAKINADGAKAELDYQQQIYDLTIKQMEQTDELAAKREEITGGSVEQRLHQSADNYIVKRDELVANHGEGSQEVSDADFAFSNEQSKIRAAGAEQNSNPVIAGINAHRTAVSDAEARGTTTTVAAQQQRIELDREEAQALGPVLATYEELANAGDLEATQKVIELKSRIAGLNDPVDEVSQHMREQFDSAFESLFENLDQGTKAFESFFRDIEKQLEQATYKRFLEPLVQEGIGKLFPNKTPGGGVAYGDAGIGGVHVPDAGAASGIGGAAVKAAASIGGALGIPGLDSLSKKGGSDKITIELVNKSGTPLAVGGTDILSKLFSKDHVISIIKDDFESGGFIRAIAGGLGGAL